MTDIDGQLEQLLKAGKITLPDSARMVAETAEEMSRAQSAWQAQTAVAGYPQTLVDAVAINDEVYKLLSQAVLTLNDAALCLVSAAEDFARTDAQSSLDVAKIQRLMQEPLVTAVVPAPHPALPPEYQS